jgi:putative hydroxymethylpyrimidine transporter CytX
MGKAGKIGGISFFALWSGAAISLAEIMTGSLIAPLGLKRGIIAILAGHLIGTLILALVGIIGFREKTPSLISSRRSLGRYGSYLISIFNIIQLVGWTAIMLIQCTRSLQSITGPLFGFNNHTALVIITGILVGIWALYINKGINIVNNIAVCLLLVLSVVMLKVIIPGGAPHHIAGSLPFGAALEMSILLPLSWVPLISDYTMSGQSARGSFMGSFWGYFLGSSFMYMTGLLSAIYAGNADPIAVLAKMNLGYSALLIVVLATVTTTFMDVYSAVMSTLNLSSRVSRKNLILLFTGLGTLLALFFPMEQYVNFLYLIGLMFAPVFSVVLLDYFLFRDDRSGHLFNPEGLAATALGVITYYAATGKGLVLGATIPSMLATMSFYILLRLTRKKWQQMARVRYQGSETHPHTACSKS